MSGVYDEAGLYCAAFDFPVHGEVEWLLARVPGARTVLEPMCGNARYGRAFVERGLTYVGFDRSPPMLARAAVCPGMTLHRADARDFSVAGGPFDLAWCPIDSIRHLVEREDVLGHLRCVRRHLGEGGVYVVEADLMRRDGAGPFAADAKSQWHLEQADGSRVEACVQAERFDLAARRMWERSTYRRVAESGTVLCEITQLHEMRLLTLDDWLALTAAAGFTIDAVFAHRPSHDRPQVPVSPDLETPGLNHYFFLR